MVQMAQRLAVLLLFTGLTGNTSLEAAAHDVNAKPQQLSASEYGATLPPIGYVTFCGTHSADCQPESYVPKPLAMTADKRAMIEKVNSFVNAKIAPVSDQELYGEPEHWAYPVDAGDCEDYVLLKKRYLQRLGLAESDLRITVVLDEKGEGHAVLTITTDAGDYILDNRRDEVLLWTDTPYIFLKRQSADNPLKWVALMQKEPKTAGFVSSRNNEK